MKEIKYLLVAMVFLFSKNGIAQASYITNLQASAAPNNQVYVQWIVPAGSASCVGVELQHSLDSLFAYTTIYTQAGVCGGSGQNEPYNYTHLNPDIKKKNYYRIFMPPNYYSTIVVVDYAKINGEYTIYPTVFFDQAQLEFSNPNYQQYVIEIGNSKGNWIYRTENIYQGIFMIYASWFTETGMYFFRLYPADGSKVIKGKFVVMKN